MTSSAANKAAYADYLLNGVAMPAPAAEAWWIASTTPPAEDGTNVTVPAGAVRFQMDGEFVRVGTTHVWRNSQPESQGALSPGATVTHLAQYSAQTGGTFQNSATLDTAQVVPNNGTLNFAANSISLDFTNI